MEQTRLQKRGQKAVFSWRSHQFERSLEIFISQGFLRTRPSEINFRLIFGVLQSNPMTVSIQDLSYSLMIYAMIKFVHTERFDLNSVYRTWSHRSPHAKPKKKRPKNNLNTKH